MAKKEDEIRVIAYNIWEEEGCPNGRDCEHWYRAEIIWEQRQKPVLKAEGKAAPQPPAPKRNPVKPAGKTTSMPPKK